MPRAKTTAKKTEAKETGATGAKPKAAPKAAPKATADKSFAYLIDLVHGAGEHTVKLLDRKTLDKFVQNVTKRNLNAYPYIFTDDAGQTFILREFLFCRIRENR
tara:strand:- start:366 stop:677 length:312 start_codon:yes stop_codon:yes gene_type:complete